MIPDLSTVVAISDTQIYIAAFLCFFVTALSTINISWLGGWDAPKVHPYAMFCYKNNVELFISGTVAMAFLFADWYVAFLPAFALFILTMLRDNVISHYIETQSV